MIRSDMVNRSLSTCKRSLGMLHNSRNFWRLGELVKCWLRIDELDREITAMKLILACLIAMFCSPFQANADEVLTNGWGIVDLWNSDVLSARLLFKPSASLADKNWLALELENHTLKPLEFGQTWMNLSMTLKEIPSGKVLTTSGLSGGCGTIKTLPPGRHRFFGGAFESASANMGLPPVTGLCVEVHAKIDTEITGGNRYQTPEVKPSFTFEWRNPSAAETTGMTQEIRQYLAAPGDLEKALYRMSALFKVPQVQESLTVEDYLPALRVSHDSNTRLLLVPNLFARYSDDPRVLAYYREALQKEPDVVYWDAATVSVWNEEFLEPLVQGCEQDKWHYFSVLRRHSAEWRNRHSYVARVSVALLKHNPILRCEVRNLPDRDLEQWAKAVLEAADVADPALVELLKPALKDQRQARIDYGAGGWGEGRVCDRALIAVLKILDGDSWTAFEAAGVTGWRTEKERLAAHDLLIGILTDRLKLPLDKK